MTELDQGILMLVNSVSMKVISRYRYGGLIWQKHNLEILCENGSLVPLQESPWRPRR